MYIKWRIFQEPIDESCKYELYESQDIGYADIQLQTESAEEVNIFSLLLESLNPELQQIIFLWVMSVVMTPLTAQAETFHYLVWQQHQESRKLFPQSWKYVKSFQIQNL